MKLSDVTCPICMYILIEPVTMPCKHELCLSCFKENISETSLRCPMCRHRISIWARRAAKANSLINQERWAEIKAAFPKKVRKKLEGAENYSSDDDDDEGYLVYPSIAKPGEIRQEYESELQKLEEELQNKKEKDEMASLNLIAQLQKVEQVELDHLKQRTVEDEKLAKELEETLNKEQKTPGTTGSKQSKTFLDKFLSRNSVQKEEVNQDYPYRCISPWEKETKSPQESHSFISISSRETSMTVTPVADETDIATQLQLNFDGQPASNASSSHHAMNLLSEMADKTNNANNHRASADTFDSITQELNHFKPIRTCPKTPPRRLPSGEFAENSLVKSTPRNVGHSSSPTKLESYKNFSRSRMKEIVKKSLIALSAERQDEVKSRSKSTATTNGFVMDHSYSSPAEKVSCQVVESHCLEKTISMRELCNKTAPSTLSKSALLKAMNKSVPRKLNFLSQKSRSSDSPMENSNSISPILPLLPLEPNFDDDLTEDIFPSVISSKCHTVETDKVKPRTLDVISNGKHKSKDSLQSNKTFDKDAQPCTKSNTSVAKSTIITNSIQKVEEWLESHHSDISSDKIVSPSSCDDNNNSPESKCSLHNGTSSFVLQPLQDSKEEINKRKRTPKKHFSIEGFYKSVEGSQKPDVDNIKLNLLKKCFAKKKKVPTATLR